MALQSPMIISKLVDKDLWKIINLNFKKAVLMGEVERDEAILREINKLCMKLTVHSGQSQQEIEKDNLVFLANLSK